MYKSLWTRPYVHKTLEQIKHIEYHTLIGGIIAA